MFGFCTFYKLLSDFAFFKLPRKCIAKTTSFQVMMFLFEEVRRQIYFARRNHSENFPPEFQMLRAPSFPRFLFCGGSFSDLFDR